jgi:intermediate peptidase
MVCNLTKPDTITNSLNPNIAELNATPFSQDDLESFWHELGHAMHTVLSQTEYHYFSGTRIPLDFAEFPSHLFEMFLTDYQFVAGWARFRGRQVP